MIWDIVIKLRSEEFLSLLLIIIRHDNNDKRIRFNNMRAVLSGNMYIINDVWLQRNVTSCVYRSGTPMIPIWSLRVCLELGWSPATSRLSRFSQSIPTWAPCRSPWAGWSWISWSGLPWLFLSALLLVSFLFLFLLYHIVMYGQTSHRIMFDIYTYSLRYEPATLVLRRTRKEAVWSESRKQQAQAFRLSYLAQILESLRDPPVSLLGRLRSGQSQRLRADWREGLHSVLGPPNVRGLLLLQHDRPPQHAHRHDVQLLSVHLSQIWHVSFRESLSLLVLFWFQRKVYVLNF